MTHPPVAKTPAPLTRHPNRVLALIVVLILFLAMIAAALILAPRSAQAASDPAIPRCINDDYNDGTQDICYTVRSDNQVILINRDDTIEADMSSREGLKSCSFYGYVGSICKFTTTQSTNGVGVQTATGGKYYAK